MATLTDIGDLLVDNFYVLLVLIAIIIVIYLITRTAVNLKSINLKSKFAQIELEHKKIDTIANKQKIENLREAAAMLTDGEREKIDSIKADTSILSRRTIALMSEIEERVARLERGTENAQLGNTINEIIKNEKKLFKRYRR